MNKILIGVFLILFILFLLRSRNTITGGGGDHTMPQVIDEDWQLNIQTRK
jgi:hypothetical protein